MINITLWKQGMKANYKIMLIFMAVLTMYISIIVSTFDPKLGQAMDEFMQMMPEMMSMFGMEKMGTELIDTMASYLYGFLLVLLPMVFEIMLANRLVAAHVDKTSMAYLLTTSNSRRKVISTQASVLLTGVTILLVFSTLVGWGSAELLFPGELDMVRYLQLNGGLWLFHFAVSGICFFSSCAFNETRQSLLFGAGIPVLFFLIQMLSNLGGKLENLRYFTILTLFSPEQIIHGDSDVAWMLGVLFGVGIVLYAGAMTLFCKRDLPL